MDLLRKGHDRVLRASRQLYGWPGQAAFVADSLRYDATIRNLELIGEAATHVPRSVRDAFPDVPWRAIVALRNRLIHGYTGIDNDIVWTIVQDAVPKTLSALHDLLDTTSEDTK